MARSKVTYICDHDFYLVGAEERTFLYDGTWDSDDPHCESVGKLAIYLFLFGLRSPIAVTMTFIRWCGRKDISV